MHKYKTVLVCVCVRTLVHSIRHNSHVIAKTRERANASENKYERNGIRKPIPPLKYARQGCTHFGFVAGIHCKRHRGVCVVSNVVP